MKTIPYARQSINAKDIQSVLRILKGDWLTQGPTIRRFETAVAEYCGANYAVALSSGTAALHLACLAGGLGQGDVLWTSPNTFVASANCALYCGASPDFVDIDKTTYNISIEALESKLRDARIKGKAPKVVVPVHFAGQSCDMAGIFKLSRDYGFLIIEDAAHAIGGAYKGKKIGACEFSDMTIFSFHPAKIITTGEGGMVLTNRRDLYEKLLVLRTHGITRDETYMQGSSDGPWYYQQVSLGMNYRMTDLQAALGMNQLARIDRFVARRRALAERYNRNLADLPVVIPRLSPDAYSPYHLYVIRLSTEKIGKTRKAIFQDMVRKKIGVNVHYIPVHTQPYYLAMGFYRGQFPEAETYYQEAITLPLYPAMRNRDQDRVIAALRESIA